MSAYYLMTRKCVVTQAKFKKANSNLVKKEGKKSQSVGAGNPKYAHPEPVQFDNPPPRLYKRRKAELKRDETNSAAEEH